MTWTYDDPTQGSFAIGRLSSMTDPAGTTVYDYDRRGLLTQEQRAYIGCFVTRESGTNCDESFESRTFTTAYRYDRDGNRSSIQYPSHKVNVNYTFDYASRPLSASGAVTAAEYLPFGPVRQLSFANGTTQTLSYDARYRITGNALSTATMMLAHYAYAYDGTGNVTAIRDVLDPRYDRTFAYDDLHRLVTANTGTALWRNGSYTWDAMGNPRTINIGEVVPSPGGGDDGLLRTGRPVRAEAEWLPGGRTLEFTYQGATPRIDRVTTNASSSPGEDPNPGLPVTYDAAGNEVGYLVTRTYSPRNLLAELVRRGDEEGDPFGEHKLLYSYDGRGIRVVRGEKPSDGIAAVARRYFIYSPELKLLSVTKDDAPNIWTAAVVEKDMQHEIVWFGDRPVAQVPLSGSRLYTFTDHLGTPILQTNEHAVVVWQAEYEPFGNIWDMRRDSEGDQIGRRTDQPLRLPGQEAAMSWEGQEESYNVHRWYRPSWGRYTSADPLGLRGDSNLFRYAANNPLKNSDPTGLKCCPRSISALRLPQVDRTSGLVAIGFSVCAEVENPADCGVMQIITTQESRAGRHTQSIDSDVQGDVTISYEQSVVETEDMLRNVQRFGNRICFDDAGVGLAGVSSRDFPVRIRSYVTAIVFDKNDRNDSIRGSWTIELDCDSFATCRFRSQGRNP